MSRILVTGATGFVGGHLSRQLVEAGHEVVALVRRHDRIPANLHGRVESSLGDLTDADSLRRAVAGCDAVCHLAALATAWDRNPNAYHQLNVEATKVLLDEAARSGVGRFVHVSTIAALPAPAAVGGRGGGNLPTPYAVSKMLAEEHVRQFVAAGGDAVIVRPSRVFGPGPWNDANGTTQLMGLYLAGRFRFLARDGGALANYVHVEDVARGIVLALDHGRPGAAYTLGGENITLKGLLDLVGEIAGIRRRVWALPPGILASVGQLGLWWGRLGGQPKLTPAWVDYFLENRPYDFRSSCRDLGYAPRSLRQGITETLLWMMGSESGECNANRAFKHLLESVS